MAEAADAFTTELQRLKDHQSRETLRKGNSPQLARTPKEVKKLRAFVNTSSITAMHQKMAAKNKKLSWTTTSDDKIDVSKTTLKNLKRISLQRIRLEEVAKGGYLILRTLEPAYKFVGITTAVEDHEGNAVLFAAYNFTEVEEPDLDIILPAGTVFILKEPYMKMSLNFGDSLVRCDSPSDMIVLFEGHELFGLAEGIVWKNVIDPGMFVDPMYRYPEPKTALQWKQRGNALFQDGKYEHSIRCYLLALQKLTELADDGHMVQILHLNLSAGYLRLGVFEKALEFAKKVLTSDNGNKKALFRAGKSCYQLRNYENAKLYFAKLCDMYPDDKETKTELHKSEERYLEEKTGEFNMHKMFLSDARHSRQKLDCADYVGPIKIIDIKGKGRGVVASRDLEPGTLLVVSKALVFEWLPMQVNSDQICNLGSRQESIAELAQLIAKNPTTFGPMVYELYDGNELVKDGSTVLFCDPETKLEPIVDVQRLKGILRTNCFSRPITPREFAHGNGCKAYFEVQIGIGLFVKPSYFNHSCLPNAFYHVLNDVMVVRAINAIKAGEEVFLPYFDPELPYSKRKIMCQRREFQCSCKLCQQDSALTVKIRSKRENIISKFHEICSQFERFQIVDFIIDFIQRELENLISEMVATYDKHEPFILKPGLSSMHLYLAATYARAMLINPEKCNLSRIIECYHKTLNAHGFDPEILFESLQKGESLIPRDALLLPDVLYAISRLIVTYHNTHQDGLKDMWIQILCSLEKVFSGGDVNVVKLNYEHIKDML